MKSLVACKEKGLEIKIDLSFFFKSFPLQFALRKDSISMRGKSSQILLTHEEVFFSTLTHKTYTHKSLLVC